MHKMPHNDSFEQQCSALDEVITVIYEAVILHPKYNGQLPDVNLLQFEEEREARFMFYIKEKLQSESHIQIAENFVKQLANDTYFSFEGPT